MPLHKLARGGIVVHERTNGSSASSAIGWMGSARATLCLFALNHPRQADREGRARTGRAFTVISPLTVISPPIIWQNFRLITKPSPVPP
jgi:hypothetical protein